MPMVLESFSISPWRCTSATVSVLNFSLSPSGCPSKRLFASSISFVGRAMTPWRR
ncbi:hypothetical protein [Pyxidicoccus sp. MSG2]|uniref:hypothetical protein n=1 Tax=Pyxidicoccus sp. MSG2 TaxID=2996790 RepID=UPI003B63F2C6